MDQIKNPDIMKRIIYLPIILSILISNGTVSANDFTSIKQIWARSIINTFNNIKTFDGYETGVLYRINIPEEFYKTHKEVEYVKLSMTTTCSLKVTNFLESWDNQVSQTKIITIYINGRKGSAKESFHLWFGRVPGTQIYDCSCKHSGEAIEVKTKETHNEIK